MRRESSVFFAPREATATSTGSRNAENPRAKSQKGHPATRAQPLWVRGKSEISGFAEEKSQICPRYFESP